MGQDTVLATERLYGAAPRARNAEAEVRALHVLARQLGRAPEAMLQRLVHVAAELCAADSAVISLLTEPRAGVPSLRWEVASGALEPYRGSIFAQAHTPCTVALERNSPQLFLWPGHQYAALSQPGVPAVHELLVLPLYGTSRAVGTLWVASHQPQKSFDGEDARILQSLVDFTAAAWGLTTTRQELVRMNTELEEAHRRKDAFFATLSHELKNPLGAIANAIDLLKGGHEKEWALEVLRRQSEQLSHLLDDVEDVARVSQGKVRLQKRVTTAQDAVEVAVLTVTHLMEERRHTLTVAVPNAPLQLLVDPPRLTQILVNLLTNAAKYTDPGGLIRISAEEQAGQVVFRVHDTGSGIRPEQLPRIFDLYAQGDAGERYRGGLGIGLSLVRGLVVLHGGTVDVRSDGAGRGSEFVVSLPMGRIIDHVAPPRPSPGAALAGDLRAAAVLSPEEVASVSWERWEGPLPVSAPTGRPGRGGPDGR